MAAGGCSGSGHSPRSLDVMWQVGAIRRHITSSDARAKEKREGTVMARSRKWALSLIVLVSLTWSLPASAQEFRGSIVGKVTDSTGGVLPGVTVTVTNNDTKIAQTLVTDGQGVYLARYLNVGTYTVTATLQGFKKVSQTNTYVTVGDTVRVDLLLEPGGMTETVEVRAETPMINTTTGISGVTITSKQIAQLPLGDGTAYMLTRLAPGIMDTSDLHFARPMDNANLSGIVANGVQGGNEFSIDGAPNLSNTKGVGFSPPSGAIAQFKVQTNAFDAQTGHTAGAVVNLALKSGTNSINGEAGYYNRDASRTETPLLTERNNGTKPTRTYNRVTGTVTGPIVPNRTFFMVSAEHLRDVQPEPSTFTVPTMKMRAGDFSEFPTLVYDPYSATLVGGTITRTPFQNNVIPSGMINPVAAKYAAMYPEPNRPGTAANYFTNMLRPYDYNAFLARVDHNFSADNRIFGNGYYNKRREDRYNWALGATNSPDGLVNGFPVTQGYDYRSNTGFVGGWTKVLSGASVFDLRMSRTVFGENRAPAAEFRPHVDGLLLDGPSAHGRAQHHAAHDVRQFQHHEPELDDRVAWQPARRLGRGIRPADVDLVAGPDTVDSLGRSHTEGRLRPALPAMGSHEHRISGRPVPLQRVLHTRYQRRRLERSRAVLGAVPAGTADRGDRRGGVAQHGVESVRDCVVRRLYAAVARALPAGRLAIDAAADSQPRGAHGDHGWHERGGRS